MKKILMILMLSLSITAFTKENEEEKKIDMSDPTQIYSSITIKSDLDGEIDGAIGLAAGKNMGKIETNKGGEEAKLYYIHSNGGKSFYTEIGVGEDWQTYSVGGMLTIPLGKSTKLFPVATIGVSNKLNEADPMVTGGTYVRTVLGKGFGLGADLFYTILMDDAGKPYDGHLIKLFASYQYKTHMVRLGYSDEVDLDTGDEGKVYLQYTLAF